MKNLECMPKNYLTDFFVKTNLSIEQLHKANDQQIINECLMLYEKEYNDE